MSIERSWLIAGGIIAILLLSTIAALVYWGKDATQSKEGLLIVLLTPGFEDEIKKLLDVEDKLVVIGAGSDPHELQLSPSDIEILKKADIIVSMGHTAVDRRAQELVERAEIRAKIINILDIRDLHIPRLPDGIENRHELYYDPRNLILILDTITDAMAELRPEKADLYKINYDKLKSEIEEFIERYEGILKGYKAVITTAEIQPAIQWLGVDVIAYVVFDQHESPSPVNLDRAIKALNEEKVILFVAIISPHDERDHEHHKHEHEAASHLDRELGGKAIEKGVPVVHTHLGYVGSSVLEKLNHVIAHVSEINRASRG